MRGGINTYGYVGGNPLSYVDPTGEAGAMALCGFGPIGCGAGAIATGISILAGGVLMSQVGSDSQQGAADTPEKKADRNAYHKVCDEPPPPGLSPCDEIRWKIGRAKRCIDMRKSYMSKWNDTYQGHYDQIANRMGELTKLERLLAELCCGK